MKKFNVLLLLLFGFTLSCTTKYIERGLTDGFSDRRIDENTFIVDFYGNGYISRDIVINYLLYRCADLTKAAGKKYFVITDSNIGYTTTYYTTQGRTSLGSYSTTSRINKPYAEAVIYITDEKPTDTSIKVWDADSILTYSTVDRGRTYSEPQTNQTTQTTQANSSWGEL